MWLKLEEQLPRRNKRNNHEIDIAEIFNGKNLTAFTCKDGRVHSIMDLENIQIVYNINISGKPFKSLGYRSVQYKHRRTELGTASISHEISQEILEKFNTKGLVYFCIAENNVILHCKTDNINEIIEKGLISFSIEETELRN